MVARMAKEAEWAKRVAAWKKSGLKPEEFARGEAYRAKTLVWWSSELRRRARRRTESSGATATPTGTNVRLARVRIAKAPPNRTLLIRVAGVEVVVERGFDGQLLSDVVQALGGAR